MMGFLQRILTKYKAIKGTENNRPQDQSACQVAIPLPAAKNCLEEPQAVIEHINSDYFIVQIPEYDFDLRVVTLSPKKKVEAAFLAHTKIQPLHAFIDIDVWASEALSKAGLPSDVGVEIYSRSHDRNPPDLSVRSYQIIKHIQNIINTPGMDIREWQRVMISIGKYRAESPARAKTESENLLLYHLYYSFEKNLDHTKKLEYPTIWSAQWEKAQKESRDAK